MKKKLTILSFVICQIALGQTNFNTFSDLSGKGSVDFVAIEVADGFVCCLREKTENKLYKIDKKGKITHQQSLNFGNYIRYGSIVSNGAKVYFHGDRYEPFDGVNINAFYQSGRKTVFEIKDDFSFGKENIYNTIPKGAGNMVGQQTGFIDIKYQNSAYFDKDTLFMVRFYSLFDTLTGTYIPGARGLQLEKTYLNSNYTYIKSLGANFGAYYCATTTPKNIYAYGEVGKITNGQILINGAPVGKFDREGNLLSTYKLEGFESGNFATGSVGQYHDAKLYSTYIKNPFGSTTDCKGEGTAIDIRDEDFKLEKIITVPDCYVIPSGSRPFAFSADKNIYLQTLSFKKDSRYAKIFKYDANFNLKWEKEITGVLFPIQIIATSDNGILAACIELGSDPSENTLRLYKLNADGNVTSITTLGNVSAAKNLFYPNPFQSQFSPQENIEGASEVTLYDISGRTVGVFALSNKVIEVNSDLPKGTYIAQIKDAKGKILGQQVMVKQ